MSDQLPAERGSTTPATGGAGSGTNNPFTGTDALGLMRQLAKRGDIALALGVVAILVVLILPMPGWLLDFSLAISITFSVMVLMTCLFIQKPLEFSSFPTVLLIATMIRLALNMASTRLILSEGHNGTDAAGQVIEAFGNFVMGGNFVIGIIVFAILVIVNFVVITKGSGRIAEVAARFTLDAMPGKQMAIDADLSAGLINEDEARTRRRDLEDESTFFGAMDGASKFVRGDAIAGLMITFINVIGGIIIGVAQNDMSFMEAGQTYTLLTVGDGLVSQIPALIVSTAAGLLVSKAGVSGSADKALFRQFSGYPASLGISSFLLVCLSLLPGIPLIPFWILAGAAGYGAWVLYRKGQREIVETEVVEGAMPDANAEPAEQPISEILAIDDLRLEIGYGLLKLVEGDTNGPKLTDQIRALRRQIATDMGFVMPSVRILDNMQLGANTYSIRIKEVEAGSGDVRATKLMVLDPAGGEIDMPGEVTTEPAFGLPAKWVDESLREEASFRGLTVVDASTVVTTHLTEVLKDHMPDLLSYAETRKLLDELPDAHRKLVDDLIPSQISVSAIQRVLQNLLAERVSIRDLATVLEGISDAVGFTKNVSLITEHVRTRLARQICNANLMPDGFLPLVTLSPDWESAFAEALTGQGEERQLAMAPSKVQEFIGAIRMTYDRLGQQGQDPVLLTSPAIRPFVRSIVERIRGATVVMSQNEVHPKVRLRQLAQV
ncbi:MAG: flagellar biosynthesis protein FlhA [Minwuia sp.]|nr:flagellar biosynthesis protein FlhA [Minwuia sp.]